MVKKSSKFIWPPTGSVEFGKLKTKEDRDRAKEILLKINEELHKKES